MNTKSEEWRHEWLYGEADLSDLPKGVRRYARSVRVEEDGCYQIYRFWGPMTDVLKFMMELNPEIGKDTTKITIY